MGLLYTKKSSSLPSQTKKYLIENVYNTTFNANANNDTAITLMSSIFCRPNVLSYKNFQNAFLIFYNILALPNSYFLAKNSNGVEKYY